MFPPFLPISRTKLAQMPAPLRLGTVLAIVGVLWLPLGLPILWLVPDPDWQSILGLGLGYGGFVGVLRWWGKTVAGRSHPLEHYGLRLASFRVPWFQGLVLGCAIVFGLYLLQGMLGWVTWQSPAENFGWIALEGLALAAGLGFAEELLFRGWLLGELQQDYGIQRAIVFSSLVFAVAHFLKPWSEVWRTLPQFPGLFLLGLILSQAKAIHLGRSMGLHSGLVWGYYLIKVGKLAVQNDRILPWISGVDGNPLAGLLGIGLLSVWYIKGKREGS